MVYLEHKTGQKTFDSPKEGKDGSFSGGGSMTLRGWLPGNFDMDLRLDKCLFASISNVMAIASGDIHVGTVELEGRSIPSLTGNLEINRAEIFIQLDELISETPQGMGIPSVMAEVDLDIPGNAWVKTPDANIEMRGEVTLHNDQKGTYLRGKLDLVRGWYNVYGNKFKVRSGRLEFVHAGGFRPVVDIEAETLDPEGRKIFLSLLWMQDAVEPTVTLVHEDPGYSETDIWKMLGGGIVQSPGGEGTSWDAVSTAQNLAVNYIERLLNSQMQGVTVEVETRGEIGNPVGGRFPEKETVIAIGKYLSQGLYIKYKQGLSITSAREIDAEYRISRFFLIRSEIIRYSEKVLQGKSRESSDEVNLDIRLRLEFW